MPPGPKKVQYPTTKNEGRSFMGLFVIFCGFVTNVFIEDAVLNRKLRNEQSRTIDFFTDVEKQGLVEPKLILTKPLVHNTQRPAGYYIIGTNTYDTQVECVLLQKKPFRNNQPTGYWSRTLSDSERKLATGHNKCSTVVWAVSLLWAYLDGKRFTICTFYVTLKELLAMAGATRKLAR